MIIQNLIAFGLMIILKSFYIIGIATLPVLFPLTDDIKCDLDAIQQSLGDKSERRKVAKPLSQFIQFHSFVEKFSLISLKSSFH